MAKRKNIRVATQSSDRFVGTGVHASIAGTQAKRSSLEGQAEALGEALNIGASTLASVRANKRQEDIDAGVLAAETGDVNADSIRLQLQERSAAWIFGNKFVLERSRAIEDEASLWKWYTTEFDKNLGVGELRDALMKKREQLYSGGDPGQIRAAAPYMDRVFNKIMGAHAGFETAEAKQGVANALSTSTIDFMKTEDKDPVRWDAMRSEYTGLFDTKEEGLIALAKDVTAYALSARDPTTLDSSVFDKLKSNPLTRQIMEKGQAQAEKDWLADKIDATAFTRAAYYENIRQMAVAKDLRTLQSIEEAVTQDANGFSNITHGEAQTLLGTYYATTSKEVMTPLMVQAIDEGRGGRDIPDKLYDESFSAWTLGLAEKGITDPDESQKAVVERVVINGKMPKYMKRQLETASPANEQLYPEAYSFFTKFERQFPGEINKYIKEDTVRDFEIFGQLTEAYGNKSATEKMKDFDASRSSKVTNNERKDSLKEIHSEIEDIPWSWTEIEDTPKLRKLLESRFDKFIGMGESVENSAKFAIAEIQNRFQYVDGQLWPAEAPWGQDADNAAEWFREEGYQPGDGKEYEIRPGNSPNSIEIREVGTLLPLAGEIIPVAEIVKQHDDFKWNRQEEITRKENEQMAEDMVSAAKDRLFPKTTHAAPEWKFLVEQHRERLWNNMSEHSRKLVIDRMVAEKRAKDESARAQSILNIEKFKTAPLGNL